MLVPDRERDSLSRESEYVSLPHTASRRDLSPSASSSSNILLGEILGYTVIGNRVRIPSISTRLLSRELERK